jgi:hypothetical protein
MKGFQIRRNQDLSKKAEDRTDSVSVRPEKQNPRMAPRRVGTEIRKSFVCCDEKTPLPLDSLPKRGIFPAAHVLLPHCPDIVIARIPQKRGGRAGQIFIDLNAQASYPLGRQWKKTLLVQHLSGIGQGCGDVFEG